MQDRGSPFGLTLQPEDVRQTLLRGKCIRMVRTQQIVADFIRFKVKSFGRVILTASRTNVAKIVRRRSG